MFYIYVRFFMKKNYKYFSYVFLYAGSSKVMLIMNIKIGIGLRSHMKGSHNTQIVFQTKNVKRIFNYRLNS